MYEESYIITHAETVAFPSSEFSAKWHYMERDEPRRASEAEILTRGLKTSPDTQHTHTQDSGENKKISRIL